MARVVIENLSKSFYGPGGQQVCALRDANLAVEDKELLVLVGPSGSGKTTLLRLIAGLEEISSGKITIDGQVVNELPPHERDIAMVFQNYALYPHMSVYENMAFGLRLRKVPKPEIDRRVREAADILGLNPCLARKPSALSGGERQRVAVGRAIVRQPKVFLFDEPLSNLDAPLRVQMRAEISRLHQRLGATMIYVTHDQLEAMTMGDRIAVMKEGVIHQVAEPLQVYRNPANLFVAGFIGSPAMNFFRGRLAPKGDGLTFIEQTSADEERALMLAVAGEHARALQAYVEKPIILGLRPEDIHYAANSTETPGGSGSAPPAVAARVEMVEPLGPETLVGLRNGAHSFTARMPAGLKLQVSQCVPLHFDMAQARYFDPATETAISV